MEAFPVSLCPLGITGYQHSLFELEESHRFFSRSGCGPCDFLSVTAVYTWPLLRYAEHACQAIRPTLSSTLRSCGGTQPPFLFHPSGGMRRTTTRATTWRRLRKTSSASLRSPRRSTGSRIIQSRPITSRTSYLPAVGARRLPSCAIADEAARRGISRRLRLRLFALPDDRNRTHSESFCVLASDGAGRPSPVSAGSTWQVLALFASLLAVAGALERLLHVVRRGVDYVLAALLLHDA